MGALIRYTGSSTSVVHMSVTQDRDSKYNLSLPPDNVWLQYPNKSVNTNGPNKIYAYTFRGEIDKEDSEIDMKVNNGL